MIVQPTAGAGDGPWMCPPCPVDCHGRVYPTAGHCADCGMLLITLEEFLARGGVAPPGDAEWKCPPCSKDCHDRVYPGAGECAVCHMTLVPLAEYRALQRGDGDAPPAPPYEERLEEIRAALEAGRLAPDDCAAGGELSDELRDPAFRRAFRALYREHPARDRLVLAGPGEPGRRLVVHGQVVDPERGAPVPGALVYLYQTDARGIYAPPAEGGSDNPRLFGFVRTADDGRFRVHTVVPASYPDTRVARHVHYVVRAPERAARVAEFLFADDPLLDAETRAMAQREGFPIVSPEEGPEGGLTCEVVVEAGARY